IFDWQFLLLLFNSSANFWWWHLFSSGSGNNLHWQWELILLMGTLTWQWECLVHFIPNKDGNHARANVKQSLGSFFIIAVQTPGSEISILLAVGTPSTGSGNLYCQWELSPGTLVIVPTTLPSQTVPIYTVQSPPTSPPTLTKKVEENLHVNFLENKPNVVGSGPEWLFDIDSLTNSMNYQPVSAGNRSNGISSLKIHSDVGQEGKEKVFDQEYILLLVMNTSSDVHSSKVEVESSLKDNAGKKSIIEPTYAEGGKIDDLGCLDQQMKSTDDSKNTNSTNSFNTASPTVNTASDKDGTFQRTYDTGIFDDAYDDRDEGAEADYNNLETGHKQEEGIDYDEVFAPVARIKSIRLFLAYASFMDFTVYQMYIKSAFLYGTIKEEVMLTNLQALSIHNFQIKRTRWKKLYMVFIKLLELDDIIFGSTKWSLSNEFEQLMNNRFQVSFMRELTFFLGLQAEQRKDAIFLSQDKSVCDILKKSGFSSVKLVSTPMETHKPLSKDSDGTNVDVHLYRYMIGSLMYLTSSMPEIMFTVCACSRFQVQPKVSHMHAVKRILRYLKGHPTLGLWYPKDSPLELIAYSDSDYAGASLDRKSTIGGCQYLGSRLRSWHHFIRDSYEKRLIKMVKIHTDSNAVDLLTKAFDVTRFQFLVASIDFINTTNGHQFTMSNRQERTGYSRENDNCSKTVNSAKQMHVVVDGKVIVISESLVRGDLLFDNDDGNVTPLFETMLVEHQAPKGEGSAITPKPQPTLSTSQQPTSEEGDRVERAITIDASLEAAQNSGNITKAQTMAMPNVDIPQGIDTCGRPRRQETMGEERKEEAEAQGDNDQVVKELKLYMRIILEEDIAIEAIPLAIKPLVIIEYKIVKEGKISTYHITRAKRRTKRYTSMINLLENIDRKYLETFSKLVKDKYGNTRPEKGYERVLYGNLKVMFEPYIESEVLRQLQGHDVTVWKLCSSCGVHFVRFKNLHIFLLVDKVYPFTPATIKMMLERKLQADKWNEMCYQLLKLMMKQLRKQ
nr:copia protein [Tanacetum cinerariifolium]